MNAEMKNYVIKLLETYHDRERKIAVLRYDLEHPSEVGVTEQIEAMNYGSGEGVGHSKGLFPTRHSILPSTMRSRPSN